MTVLPLSLIPTFAVPLVPSHLPPHLLAQVRHWREQRVSRVGERLSASV